MLPEGLLTLDAISIGDAVPSKKRTLEKAAQLLAQGQSEPSTEQIFEKLIERERLGSTGLAGGVALPHARMPGISECRGAFIRLEQAIDFDALDGQAVDLVFALLVPEESTQEHLQLLATLAKHLGDKKTCEALRQSDASRVLQIFSQDSANNAA